MTSSRLASPSLLAILCSFSLAACGGEATSPDDGDPLTLDAEIGAEGGTLKGEAGTAFAGLELVIPAGAFTGSTKVVVRPVFDPQRLPELAERVGQHFSISANAPFEKPASLTLPVEFGLVPSFGQGPEDVKVWVKKGADWSLTEPTATAKGLVTIDLTDSATAAAGVKVIPSPVACQSGLPTGIKCTNTGASLLDTLACAEAGLCLSPIGSGPVQIDGFSFAVGADGKKLGFAVPATTGVIAVSHDIASGKAANGATVALDSGARRNVALDGAGALVVGLGFEGNALAPTSGSGQLLDQGKLGFGAVRLGDGRLVRVSGDAKTSKLGMDAGNGIMVIAVSHTANLNNVTVAPDPVNANVFLLADGPHLSSITVDKAGKPTAVDVPLPIDEALNAYLSNVVKAPNGAIAVRAVPGGVFLQKPGGAFTQVPDIVSPRDIAFDPTGNLFISSAVSPEIAVVTAAGGVRAFRLSDADPSTAGFANAIVAGIEPLPGGGAVFLTQGRTFLKAALSP